MKLDGERTVQVRVRRHPNWRSIRLSVRPDGQVLLTAPGRTRDRELRSFLNRHGGWLQDNLPATPASVPEALELRAVNRIYRLQFGTGAARLSLAGSTIRLPAGPGPESYAAIRRWLMGLARQELGSELDRLSALTGIPYRRLTIRGQRSRWGSYSSNGSVSLNFKLLFLPPELMRYVLIHELCHAIHMNHSPAFWAEVARHEPQVTDMRRRMRTASSFVPDWLGHT